MVILYFYILSRSNVQIIRVYCCPKWILDCAPESLCVVTAQSVSCKVSHLFSWLQSISNTRSNLTTTIVNHIGFHFAVFPITWSSSRPSLTSFCSSWQSVTVRKPSPLHTSHYTETFLRMLGTVQWRYYLVWKGCPLCCCINLVGAALSVGQSVSRLPNAESDEIPRQRRNHFKSAPQFTDWTTPWIHS